MLIQSLRPQRFSQVVGNQLNNKLLLAIAKNPINAPSTIILQGQFGSGKTTTARLFARAMNCKNLQDKDICGKCSACTADLDHVPWYSEFDSTAMGNVDAIRELRDSFLMTAVGYNKVIVLDETHTISKQGQSALVKVFEETPQGVFFVLPTTDPDKLLPTIRSRSLELVYTAKSLDDVKKNIFLKASELGIPISQKVVDIIALRSRGVMRNAHMMLDKYSLLGEDEFLKAEIPTVDMLCDYVEAIFSNDKVKLFKAVSDLSRVPTSYLKEDWQDFFLSLLRASIDPTLIQNERQVKIATRLGRILPPAVREFTSDWVLKSFQSSVQCQTALLALFQSYNQK